MKIKKLLIVHCLGSVTLFISLRISTCDANGLNTKNILHIYISNTTFEQLNLTFVIKRRHYCLDYDGPKKKVPSKLAETANSFISLT